MAGAGQPSPLCRERTGDNWVDSGTSCKTQTQHPRPTGTNLRAKALGAPDAMAIVQASLPVVLRQMSAAQIKKMQHVLDAGVLDPKIEKDAQKFYSRAYTRVGSLTFKDEALIHRGDKVMEDYISIKKDDYRIRLDYTALLTSDALSPATDNPDEAAYLKRVRNTLDEAGVWLRFDEKRVRSADDPSQWVDDPHSYEAWLSLGAYGGVIPTTSGLLNREALLNNNHLGCGYYESVYRGTVQRSLDKEIQRLDTDITGGLETHRAMASIRRTAFPGVTEVSDLKGGVTFPDESIWEPPRKLVVQALTLNVTGNVQKSIECTVVAGLLTKLAARELASYIDGTTAGAQWAAKWANRVRIAAEVADDVITAASIVHIGVIGVRALASRYASRRAAASLSEAVLKVDENVALNAAERKAVSRLSSQAVVDKEAQKQAVREITDGYQGEYKALLKQGETKLAGQAARLVTRSTAYVERSGITQAHFKAFQEAAREKKVIALVRNSNPKAIRLIEQGCPGKPKVFEPFNTHPDTGILTAKTEADKQLVLSKGYLLVNEEGVATRRLANGTLENVEVKNSLTGWTLDPGQVIDPKLMKPVVGDYDLMGVFSPTNPGQNIALIASDGAKVSNVTSPIVKDFSDAANRRFDIPRVLHGAQDQYAGFRKGATAFFPDGTVQFLETEQDVKAFYGSVGREPAAGAYPRPDALIPDDQLPANVVPLGRN